MRTRLDARRPRGGVGLLLAAALIAGNAAAFAQGPSPAGERRPTSPVFAPLLGDPKEPQFFATYLWARSPRLASRLGSVGFGQTIGLLRGDSWQLAIAAGAFSQFNMQSATNDLINTDYLVGLPLAYQRGGSAARLRLYHQSSHLGDEYIARTHAQRVDLTFEAAELLVSNETAHWRVYGGGGYIFSHSPTPPQHRALHGRGEYQAPALVPNRRPAT